MKSRNISFIVFMHVLCLMLENSVSIHRLFYVISQNLNKNTWMKPGYCADAI